MRLFFEKKLVIASHNDGKIREIADLLAEFFVEVVSAKYLDLEEPEETGNSFIENAVIKAVQAAKASNLPSLADDSGLSVTALAGYPGIYSARIAGPTKDFALAMQDIESRLVGKSDRSAQFICALALAWPDGHVESFEGKVAGTMVWPPRGELGFGYDPVFVADGMDVTFAEMQPAEKHRISHRADAFARLVRGCFGKNPPYPPFSKGGEQKGKMGGTTKTSIISSFSPAFSFYSPPFEKGG